MVCPLFCDIHFGLHCPNSKFLCLFFALKTPWILGKEKDIHIFDLLSEREQLICKPKSKQASILTFPLVRAEEAAASFKQIF